MKTYNINKIILSAGLGLTLFAMPTVAAAQDLAEETTAQQAPKKRPAKQAPKYKMKEICGYVFDAATKKPIDGAQIQAYGHKRYTAMTDENGVYTFQVPVFVNSIIISLPEYNSVQVAFDSEEVPDVCLYSDKFNSVYDKQTSITSSNIAKIDQTSAVVVDEEIENKLASDIHSINRTGLRAQGAAMFIRGLNSLNINAQPLVVLDGIMLDLQQDRTTIHDGFFNNILSTIDPEDIASIEVLKNATSLYGARGANGVIVITTKRGTSMATRINVNMNAGFETVPSTTKMMNASQYRNYASDIIGTTEYGKKYSTATISIPFLNSNSSYYWYPMFHNETDWSDGLYRTAATQNYKVNVQGGDDMAMYSLSIGYANSQSTAKKNDFDRLNIRFNTDIKLKENIETQLDLAFSQTSNNMRDNGWAESYASSTISSPNVLGLIQSPFLSKYSYYTGEDGKLHQSTVYAGKYVDDANYPFNYAAAYGTNAALANPYWILDAGDGVNKNHQEMTQFNLNIQPKLRINDNLYITNRFAYQLNRINEKYYLPNAGTPRYALVGYGYVTSVVKSLFSKETAVFDDLRINWSNQYGMHNVKAFGGLRYSNNRFSDSFMSGYNASNDKMPDLSNSLNYRKEDGNEDGWRNLAYYVQGDWNIKETYYLEGTVSAETSSRFGKEAAEGMKLFGVRWGIFPSLQAGWVISNEEWLKKNKGINYLKLTVGYDEAGNDNIDYALASTYFKSYTYLQTANGLQLANIENPAIQWETTRTWNFALNGSFINNRVQAGINFYVKNTDNLITYETINYMSGFPGNYVNGGALRNVGVEMNVNGIIVNSKDFKFQLGAALGHYKNRITALPGDSYTTKIYGAEVLTSVGNPAGLFYGYKTNGVFASDAEAMSATTAQADGYLKYPTGINSNPYKNFSAGDVHFVDQNKDGIIDDNDKVIIGDPNPDIFGSFYANFHYKRWSLDFNFKYSLGNDIYNYQRSQLESANGFNNQTTTIVNRWKYEGQHTDIPRAVATTSDDWVNNERFSDRWIEDGSYLKLKKVRLTYELPINSTWIQGMNIWAEANNLFTVSPYTGTDPEFSCSNSVLYQGIDAGLLPQSRSFNIGVKINL